MFEVVRKICQTGIVTRKETRGEMPKRCRGKLEAQEDKCDCCGNCAAACPTKAIGVLPEQTAGKPIISISYERCIFCGACAKVCATGALKLSNNPCPIIIKAPEDGAEPSVKNKTAKKIFKKSLHIRHLDSGSCNGCDFEMNTLTNPIYDIQRFGVDFVASPRHADMLMVTGGVTRHLEQAVRETFSAAAHPKIVVAVGACACGGGIFGPNYAGCAGADKTVPVFINIPGCPPRPQALIEGILAAMEHDF